jgi:hypothetical protein
VPAQNFCVGEQARRESLGTDSLIFDRFRPFVTAVRGNVCKFFLQQVFAGLDRSKRKTKRKFRQELFARHTQGAISELQKNPYFIAHFAMPAKSDRYGVARKHKLSMRCVRVSKARRFVTSLRRVCTRRGGVTGFFVVL